MVEWRGVRYSVPVRCLGQRAEVRQEIDAGRIEVRWAGEVVAIHRIPDGEVREVWDGDHFAQAQAAALGRHRRHLRVVAPEGVEPVQERLELGAGEYDVERLDLARYGVAGPHPGITPVPPSASTGGSEAGFAGGEPE